MIRNTVLCLDWFEGALDLLTDDQMVRLSDSLVTAHFKHFLFTKVACRITIWPRMGTLNDTPDHPPSDVLSTTEVAELLKIHKRTVARLAREGRIPAKKQGAKWQFTRTDLTKYVSAAMGTTINH